MGVTYTLQITPQPCPVGSVNSLVHQRVRPSVELHSDLSLETYKEGIDIYLHLPQNRVLYQTERKREKERKRIYMKTGVTLKQAKEYPEAKSKIWIKSFAFARGNKT